MKRHSSRHLTINDKINNIIESLPEKERAAILEFSEFIKNKKGVEG